MHGLHDNVMNSASPEVILALDLKDKTSAREIIDAIGPKLHWVKVGLQTYLRDGPDFIEELSSLGKKVFLDLKLHDIPNTMASAIESLSSLPVKMLTLHASSGKEAMQRCHDEVREKMPDTLLLAVTVLTSMNRENLLGIGVENSIENQVEHLAMMACESGIRGIVCSPRELCLLRAKVPPDTKLITPGIRPSGSNTGDQKRIMTPLEAKRAGAHFLVIGRPILQAKEPAKALDQILSELDCNDE